MKRCVLLLCSVLILAGCVTTTTTSPTGRRQVVGGISQTELNRLGHQTFNQLKEKQTLSQDRRQIAYVQCVLDAIVAELPEEQRYLNWELAVFVDNEPNAFALPGGRVGVHTGLLNVALNQDQLAAVIGHEIGHVIANHHEESITQQQNAQVGLGILSGLATAGTGSKATGDMVNQVGAIGAQTLFLLPGSRTQEREADVVGQRLMARAGFDPAQAVVLWHNMNAASRGQRPPKWLSTHPAPQDRINQLQRDVTGLLPVYQEARRNGRTPRCR